MGNSTQTCHARPQISSWAQDIGRAAWASITDDNSKNPKLNSVSDYLDSQMVVKKSFQLNSDNADSKVRHSVKEAINEDAASVNSGELSTWGVLSRFCDCGVSIKGSGGDEAVLSPQGKLDVLLMAKRNGTPLGSRRLWMSSRCEVFIHCSMCVWVWSECNCDSDFSPLEQKISIFIFTVTYS